MSKSENQKIPGSLFWRLWWRALSVKRQEAERIEQARQAAAAKARAEAMRSAEQEAQRQAELAAAREAQLKAEAEATRAREEATRAQAQARAAKETPRRGETGAGNLGAPQPVFEKRYGHACGEIRPGPPRPPPMTRKSRPRAHPKYGSPPPKFSPP